MKKNIGRKGFRTWILIILTILTLSYSPRFSVGNQASFYYSNYESYIFYWLELVNGTRYSGSDNKLLINVSYHSDIVTTMHISASVIRNNKTLFGNESSYIVSNDYFEINSSKQNIKFKNIFVFSMDTPNNTLVEICYDEDQKSYMQMNFLNENTTKYNVQDIGFYHKTLKQANLGLIYRYDASTGILVHARNIKFACLKSLGIKDTISSLILKKTNFPVELFPSTPLNSGISGELAIVLFSIGGFGFTFLVIFKKYQSDLNKTKNKNKRRGRK